MSFPKRNVYFKPTAEWLMWMILVLIALSQVDNFSQEIAAYKFDADGWPITITLALGVGATLQFFFQLWRLGAGVDIDDSNEEADTGEKAEFNTSRETRLTNIAIFLLPFVYLYFAPRMGIYFITPIFIISLMLLLKVRSIKALLGITAVAYLLLLVVFTRFFYVALPVGRWDFFYDFNNWIIVVSRIGM
ncbi:MAG: tripartite tricarboxylate transporter TctB family protein [Rhodobacteraceae bacterium]|nr:tripartite tricarboxylate transporter TctB family protein [Paracoccaceae bacterium]MCY4248878.1 tripartite tricarboxylate transporter TctB family protein [Paracoccaceae bacterium]MCY4307283.1 tripartite tricarboxylate transporter TctB family protein [Paracoccaceae bacterium]